MDLSGRTIVVTGGSSGIGRETCLKAAKYGADIVVADLVNEPRDGGQSTVEAVRDLGQRSTFVEADVRELTDMQAAIEAGEEFGGVDGVVNNAGYAQSHSLTDTDPHNWENRLRRISLAYIMAVLRAYREWLTLEGPLLTWPAVSEWWV